MKASVWPVLVVAVLALGVMLVLSSQLNPTGFSTATDVEQNSELCSLAQKVAQEEPTPEVISFLERYCI